MMYIIFGSINSEYERCFILENDQILTQSQALTKIKVFF